MDRELAKIEAALSEPDARAVAPFLLLHLMEELSRTPELGAPPYFRFLPSRLPMHPRMRVLELGTGNGSSLLQLAAWARATGTTGTFVGLDSDPSRKSPFEEHAKAFGLDSASVSFIAADALSTPPDLAGFDVVLCFQCISCMTFQQRCAPERRDSAGIEEHLGSNVLAHWRSILRSGGTLVLSEVHRESSSTAAARFAALYERKRWPLLPASILRRSLARAGFTNRRESQSMMMQFQTADDAEHWFDATGDATTQAGPFPALKPSPTTGPVDEVWMWLQAENPS